MKACIKCSINKELMEFVKRHDSKDGRKNICKICDNIRLKNRKSLPENKIKIRISQNKYANNDENKKKIRLRARLNYYNNPEKCRLKSRNQRNRTCLTIDGRFGFWRRQAKDRNISFDLDLEYIKSLPLICHYTGLILTTESYNYNTVSLDRIDNTKGYTKNNVVLCCTDINYMKLDFTLEQFLSLCEKVCAHMKLNH